ncbi:MAG: orotidine-5'-phosphate decarboxylase [Candidatus Korarchaeota archaeon]|nr:orotidine-5'-phosphate decarboxylase [Candidatus Korarchaeota archaeon]NIU81886.1 orotidine-5'-phosphate decarboxylase [Candidatus Thorarchaeota archaeon]NIW12339.1 orotidine-5'-phosphate decarboxylase [Candidatus Thorarchaeota archaeon]NIW50616.1 orotidine-5'-phosphate decarboxylase [Candidatus Korarchaeota archaeon]
MFIDNLIDAIIKYNTRVCCGLDPRIKEIEEKYKTVARYWIPPSLVRENVEKYGKAKGRAKAVEDFVGRLVHTVDPHVAVYKPNIAYFEALGKHGLGALKQTIDIIHETGKMAILDAKVSDIGPSALHYGIAFFEYLQVDAVTLNPYLGSDTIKVLLDNFVKGERGIFVLCKTSNPSSKDFQDKKVHNRPLFEVVAEKIKEWGSQFKGSKGWSEIGAVVGATYPQQLKRLRKKLNDSFFLIPGLGIQGGKPEDVARFGTNEDGLGAIFNSSRGINYAYQKLGYPEEDWLDAAEEQASTLKEKINAAIGKR